MTHKFRTRDEDKSVYGNFLKKAGEFLHAAAASFEKNEYNAASSNAVHVVISASDALCVYFLGRRSAGDSHEEAIALFNSLSLPTDEKEENARRISRVLGIKNMAGYESRLVFRQEAENAIRDADRFLLFARKSLPII